MTSVDCDFEVTYLCHVNEHMLYLFLDVTIGGLCPEALLFEGAISCLRVT